MPDHIHMLVTIPPKCSVSRFMGYLKGKSAMMIYERHAKLKYKFGNRHFWAEGYYVSTVGINEATIRKYIREQETHDQIMVDMTWNSVLRSLGEPRLEICLFLDSKVPDWQGGASTPANATKDCLRSKRRTSPISAIS